MSGQLAQAISCSCLRNNAAACPSALHSYSLPDEGCCYSHYGPQEHMFTAVIAVTAAVCSSRCSHPLLGRTSNAWQDLHVLITSLILPSHVIYSLLPAVSRINTVGRRRVLSSGRLAVWCRAPPPLTCPGLCLRPCCCRLLSCQCAVC